MHHSTLSLLALLPAFIVADINANDVPSQCRDICAPVFSLTLTCDNQTDDDAAAARCACAAPNSAPAIIACEACANNFIAAGTNFDDADDIDEIQGLLAACSLSRASFTGLTATPTPTRSSNDLTYTTSINNAVQTRVFDVDDDDRVVATTINGVPAAIVYDDDDSNPADRTRTVLGVVGGLATPTVPAPGVTTATTGTTATLTRSGTTLTSTGTVATTRTTGTGTATGSAAVTATGAASMLKVEMGVLGGLFLAAAGLM